MSWTAEVDSYEKKWTAICDMCGDHNYDPECIKAYAQNMFDVTTLKAAEVYCLDCGHGFTVKEDGHSESIDLKGKFNKEQIAKAEQAMKDQGLISSVQDENGNEL